MTAITPRRRFDKEIRFRTSRSSGKGGQHVNKVATKVELIFNVSKSKILDDAEKALLKERLGHRLSAKGDLRIVTELFRSQLKNKLICTERFYKMIEKALQRPACRIPTEPSRASIERRYRAKHLLSQKKQARKKVDLNRAEESSLR